MDIRIDKWLQVARVFKTRTRAGQACKLGRVSVNGQFAKAHRSLRLEDRIEVHHGDWNRILIVKELRDKPVPKAEAQNLYEDLSPPRPKRDLSHFLSTIFREKGSGRPTKKDRREIEQLKKS